jgi:peptidoglycan-associated lipoprotein
MSPTRHRRLASAVALGLVLLLAACGGKKRPPALTSTPGEGGAPSSAPAETSPAQPIDEGPDVRAVGGEEYPSGSDLPSGDYGTAGEGGPLDDIRFAYDSANLTDEARSTLEKHALWLQSHRETRVTIEGHCDERGTVEYNLALGEQRARAARDYLVSLGVAPDRLRTVSYGKERPLDPAGTEEAWARNRRDHFQVSRQ